MTFTPVPKKSRKKDPEIMQQVKHMPCLVCRKSGPSDPSHIRSRGSGGPDTDWNVVPKCREHHAEWHQIGVAKFLDKYPDFYFELRWRGWEWQNGKFWHPNLAPEFC